MKKDPPEKFLVIDGNSLLYRAFYALPPLQNRRGEHTNALYGFTSMLLKLLEEEDPDCLAVAFDPPGPSFRVRIDPSYKAQREKAPPELTEQVRRCREILEAMRIPVFEVEDYEADDVIGALAARFSRDGWLVTVVSGDADLLQLIDDRVRVLLTKKGITVMERYDRALLRERYGLAPEQIIDYKALKGDPSDNIPGVPGIGEKTARGLLEAHGSIEGVYANLDKLKERVSRALEEHRGQLEMGRRLISLQTDLALNDDPDNLRRRPPDYGRLLPLLEELEFKSLIGRLGPPPSAAGENAAPRVEVKVITGSEELGRLFDTLGEGDRLYLVVEQESGRPSFVQPATLLALAAGPGRASFIDLFGAKKREAAAFKMVAALVSRGVSLVVHNAKQWYHLFGNLAVDPPPFAFDTMLAAYLVDPARGAYDLPSLLRRRLGVEAPAPPGGGEADRSVRGRMLAAQAAGMPALQENLEKELAKESLLPLLFDLELPLSAVLARMERRGITVDSGCLRNLSAEICRRLDELEAKIHALAGEEFNLNSPKQLSRILFDKLQLPTFRKTKTGRSTDARVLEELALHHEIAALLIHYRQLSKLEGTYLSGLVELVEEPGRKLYTNFNQAATATGRLSSSDPNLQNIPVRMEEGRRIRRAFVPSTKEKIFLAADYSQVELRVLAHLSKDPILVEAFNTGQDIHLRTAAEVNGIPLEKVTPLMREKAKAVNFGIIYGSSDYGLAQGLKISRAEAKAYMDNYFERYRGVRSYMDMIVEQAREVGYVTTLLNRRRHLPEIRSSNHNTRSFAERMALNTPIQGSAADIIKLAMITIDRITREGGFGASMLLQIHDELLFELDRAELDFFAPLVRREMEEAYTLSVPLRVDLKLGSSWEELKKF